MTDVFLHEQKPSASIYSNCTNAIKNVFLFSELTQARISKRKLSKQTRCKLLSDPLYKVQSKEHFTNIVFSILVSFSININNNDKKPKLK